MELKYCPHCLELVSPEQERCSFCGKGLAAKKEDLFRQDLLPAYSVLKDQYMIGEMVEDHTEQDILRYIGLDITRKKKVWVEEFYPEKLVFRDMGERRIQIYAGQKDLYLQKYNEFVCLMKSQQKSDSEHGNDLCFENGTVYAVYPLTGEEEELLKNHFSGEDLTSASTVNPKKITPYQRKIKIHFKNKSFKLGKGIVAAGFLLLIGGSIGILLLRNHSLDSQKHIVVSKNRATTEPTSKSNGASSQTGSPEPTDQMMKPVATPIVIIQPSSSIKPVKKTNSKSKKARQKTSPPAADNRRKGDKTKNSSVTVPVPDIETNKGGTGTEKQESIGENDVKGSIDEISDDDLN